MGIDRNRCSSIKKNTGLRYGNATSAFAKCLIVLRYCLPIVALIDGVSYDGATMIGDSGASRLTTAFMMLLVRRNLAFSPIGWLSWAAQVLVATYVQAWAFRDMTVLIIGMSSFRLMRYFEQKRLKKKRKRRWSAKQDCATILLCIDGMALVVGSTITALQNTHPSFSRKKGMERT